MFLSDDDEPKRVVSNSTEIIPTNSGTISPELSSNVDYKVSQFVNVINKALSISDNVRFEKSPKETYIVALGDNICFTETIPISGIVGHFNKESFNDLKNLGKAPFVYDQGSVSGIPILLDKKISTKLFWEGIRKASVICSFNRLALLEELKELDEMAKGFTSYQHSQCRLTLCRIPKSEVKSLQKLLEDSDIKQQDVLTKVEVYDTPTSYTKGILCGLDQELHVDYPITWTVRLPLLIKALSLMSLPSLKVYQGSSYTILTDDIQSFRNLIILPNGIQKYEDSFAKIIESLK